MEKIVALVNIASSSYETRFFAQSANSAEYETFPFGNAEAIEKALIAIGARVQQNDGKRMLVNHKAWVSTNGVIDPVRTNNL